MSDCVHCTQCALQRMELTLNRMEKFMATEIEQLNAIKAKLSDVHDDVKAKLDEVRAEVSPQGQAALDEIVSALDSFDAEIGDADGSDAAAQTPPANPGQQAGDTAASEPTDAPVVGPANATDENGTPVDADGNPLA